MDKKIIPVQISPGQMGTITLSTPQRSNQQTPPALAVEQVEATGSTIKEEIVEEILTQEEVRPLSTRVATDGNRQVSLEEAKAIPDPEKIAMDEGCDIEIRFKAAKRLNAGNEQQKAYYKIASSCNGDITVRSKTAVDLIAQVHAQVQSDTIWEVIARIFGDKIEVRFKAAQKLENQEKKQKIYYDIAKTFEDYEFVQSKTKKLFDRFLIDDSECELDLSHDTVNEVYNEIDSYIYKHEQTQLEAAELLTDRAKQQEVLFSIATYCSMGLFTRYEAIKSLTDVEKRKEAYLKLSEGFNRYELKDHQKILFQMVEDNYFSLSERLNIAKSITDEGQRQRAYFTIATSPYIKDNHKIIMKAVELIENHENKENALLLIIDQPCFIHSGYAPVGQLLKDFLKFEEVTNDKLILRVIEKLCLKNNGYYPITKKIIKWIVDPAILKEALLQIIKQSCFNISDTANNKDIETIHNTLKNFFVEIYPLLVNEDIKRLLIFKMITNKKIPKDYCKKMVEQHEANAGLKTQLLYDIENDQVYQVKTTKSARKGIEIID
jgi:hypothetical protein